MPVENADTLANTLFASLTTDVASIPTVDFTDPKFDYTIDITSHLHGDPEDITLEDLTTVSLTGTGVFDKLMKAVDNHIKQQLTKGRITGDQYADVYSKALGVVLGTSTQFLLSKDQARWQAIQAQMQARVAEIETVKALVDLEKAKLDTTKANYDMKNSGAQYALTKINIANANQQHALLIAQEDKERFTVDSLLPVTLSQEQYKLSQVMPLEQTMLQKQVDKEVFSLTQTLPTEKLLLESSLEKEEFSLKKLLPLNLAQEQHNLNYTLPLQRELIQEQIEKERAQTLDTRRDGMTPTKGLAAEQKLMLIEQRLNVTKERDLLDEQVAKLTQERANLVADLNTKTYQLSTVLPKQVLLISEQLEAERAKTTDTRTNGDAIVGSVGKQKDLYTQQIDSFKKDAKYKVAKMYLDGWVTQKTLDEGLLAPTQLQNAAINDVLAEIRIENSL